MDARNEEDHARVVPAKYSLVITIESTKVRTTCLVCGRWISKSHGNADWVIVVPCVIGLYMCILRTCAIDPDAINVLNVRIT